jgi:hypothetical protein
MDIPRLLVTRTKAEVVFGFLTVVSFVMGVVQAVITKETRIGALIVLALLFFSVLAWFVALITRPAFTVSGYSEVVALLAKIAKTSRHKLWTVRSHTGVGIPEDAYFQAIEDRLRDRAKPLEDFRRIVRLCPNARDDLRSLIARFYRQDNVSVHYYQNHGPQFDFMIVDRRIGAIGFPMAGGKGNVGAVVLRRPEAVKGLETIFEELCRESQLLFEGDARHGPQTEAQLQKKLDGILSIARLGILRDNGSFPA